MIYPAHCSTCGNIEVTNPMSVDFPARHSCGGTLKRRYTPTAVHFNASGFYTTDVSRMQKLVGPERFARFEREKAAAETRAATGTQNAYETALEGI